MRFAPSALLSADMSLTVSTGISPTVGIPVSASIRALLSSKGKVQEHEGQPGKRRRKRRQARS